MKLKLTQENREKIVDCCNVLSNVSLKLLSLILACAYLFMLFGCLIWGIVDYANNLSGEYFSLPLLLGFFFTLGTSCITIMFLYQDVIESNNHSVINWKTELFKHPGKIVFIIFLVSLNTIVPIISGLYLNNTMLLSFGSVITGIICLIFLFIIISSSCSYLYNSYAEFKNTTNNRREEIEIDNV